MEGIVKDLIDSPVKLGVVTLSLASLGYALLQGLKRMSDKSQGTPPPGPLRDFLIGNLRQFPPDHFYEKFCEWQRVYGDIVSVHLPGVPMVIINSYNVAQDILNKRLNTTGGRKIPYMLLEVMNWQWSMAFLQPGPSHSNQRKMLRRGIGPQGVGSHGPKVESNTNELMVDLQDFKGNPQEMVLRTVGQVVIEVAYGNKVLAAVGKELSSWNDEAVEIINPAFTQFWLVDVFHFLRFVPSWLPGAGFRRLGIQSTKLSHQIRYIPYEKALALHKAGKAGHSLVVDLLDEFGPNDDIRDALGLLYLAGAESTTASVISFFHAMFLFPEVLEKVQKEILAITEGLRMPRIGDRPSLPYTEAVWKESFRWNPIIPIGVPHLTTTDEVVDGYTIKAGTMIHVNIGSMMMDPKTWGDPETFRPERFLAADTNSLPNPLVVSFGFGMRVCPGMYLANQTGFHIAVTMAALYNLVPLEGRSRPKPELAKYTDTLFRLPLDFECQFVPRDSLCLELLKAIRLEA